MASHLVGVFEIATMLGVSRQRVGQLIEQYPDFPKPEAVLSAGRIWARSAIEGWIAMHPERKRGEAVQGGLFQRLTESAKSAIVLAQQEAVNFKHNYIGTEHLLLGLRAQGSGVAAQALGGAGDIPLEQFRATSLALIPAGDGPEPKPPHIPFTPRAKNVLECAWDAASDLGESSIDTEHVLLGILAEGSGVAVEILRRLGIEPAALREATLALAKGGQAAPKDKELRVLLELVLERLDRIEQRLGPVGT